MQKIFTSESVTEGHPDKICDQISDAVLDAILEQDPGARVACETFTTTGLIQMMGEITTAAKVDYEQIARDIVCDIGYNDSEIGFDGKTCAVLSSIHKQSPDISDSVSVPYEIRRGLNRDIRALGAGDQGMMFGFACDETPELMPMPIQFAHQLTNRLTECRKDGMVDWLRPDGKSQVTILYEDGKPVGIDTVVISTQHSPEVGLLTIEDFIRDEVIYKVLPTNMISGKTKMYINPSGKFVIGGPMGDTGLTGRKIIVDTYGGYARHGGGAFSGKDPTKVDRSAAYAARYVAKNIVAARLARKCEVALAYAIGVSQPVSIQVETYGTGVVGDDELSDVVKRVIDLSPMNIIDLLELRNTSYRNVSTGGHFGRCDPNYPAWLPWEREDLKYTLREKLRK